MCCFWRHARFSFRPGERLSKSGMPCYTLGRHLVCAAYYWENSMADEHYLALYRKYRPMTFEDVRGRDAIVRTLRNQIMTGRISHSYLFCGTRGTGKTTIA